MIDKIALVASIILPLWNIPLVIRIIKRRSSEDISVFWAVGVWVCLLAILPSGLKSDFIVWKAFAIGNFVFFSGVTFCTLLFHKKK
ncbi:MAG: hypothetical protein ABH815_02980 [Candidatus Omnitrophota bacterium]